MIESSKDYPVPVKTDFTSEFADAVIAFGSLRLKERIPPFEWTKFLVEIPANKIYVRDLHKLWYLKGFPGICDSPEGIHQHLQQILSAQKIGKIITVGGSMGGYAALLFGHLLQADEVHAFAPQTFLPARKGRILAKTILARNWPILRRQWKLISNPNLNRRYFDLKPLMMSDRGQTEYHIYFSAINKKDAIHAERMASLPNVHLHKQLTGGHHLSGAMRDSGVLKELLIQAIQFRENERKT